MILNRIRWPGERRRRTDRDERLYVGSSFDCICGLETTPPVVFWSLRIPQPRRICILSKEKRGVGETRPRLRQGFCGGATESKPSSLGRHSNTTFKTPHPRCPRVPGAQPPMSDSHIVTVRSMCCSNSRLSCHTSC